MLTLLKAQTVKFVMEKVCDTKNKISGAGMIANYRLGKRKNEKLCVETML